MDREVYEVIRDRFHLYDPRQYILQGTWPKDAEMKAYLDRKPLQARIGKIEIVSAMERFKDPDRIRGERITATTASDRQKVSLILSPLDNGLPAVRRVK